MKKYQIVLTISICYILFMAISVIAKEGYGGFFNELMLLASVWYMGAWYEAAHTSAMMDEEDEDYGE